MNHLNILIFFIFINLSWPAKAVQLQSIKSIQQAVKLYIAKNLPLNTEYKVKQNRIDPRLQLPLCPETLEIFTHKENIRAGRNSIGIRCNNTHKWTIYTSTIIYIYKNVVTLTQSIQRGDRISADLLQFEKKDISTLRSKFFTNTTAIINKQATRNLAQGTIINFSNLTEPKLIKRGERVNIQTSSQNLVISMAGIAMMDGKKGQNIRIKNIKSQQIVYATVVKSGQVMVTF